ncbi:MAG TPA: Spy/CpxP family protein refolding chaperone [Alloacidobacterium sp.]|nr:Spy/CpxP family protein refolding chaperone [Alloacidobacterium sp.]
MSLTRKKLPILLLSLISLLGFSAAAPSSAQDWRGGGGPGGPGGPCGSAGGPMEHYFRGGERGRWWSNPQIAQQIGLTDAQKKQMDDILQQHRLRLIDLNAALEKQEVLLRPLLGADQPDETKVLSQIDAIAQARADLEKENARMLFGIRKVLTPDQWTKLKTLVKSGPPRMGRDRGGWSGRSGNWRGPNGPGGSGSGASGQPAPPPPPPSDQ